MNLSQLDVLPTDLLAHNIKEKILVDLAQIKGNPFKLILPENYSVKALDHYGRIAVVQYRGMEVMLMFKRMTAKYSVFNLETNPSAYLKNIDDAWIVIKLIDLFPGMTLAEKISKLEEDTKNKDALIAQLTWQLEQADILSQDLLSKKRKKAAKTAPVVPTPIPIASPDINQYLLKVKPIKLQDLLRALWLWGQGFDTNLVWGHWSKPPVPSKYTKKIDRHLKKLDKMYKEAKLNREIGPYVPRPPKQLKKKSKKKGKKP